MCTNNIEILKNMFSVVDFNQKKLIEELAQSFSIEENREWKRLSMRFADDPNQNRENREQYWNLLKKALAFDLAYNGQFDGELSGWSLMACGVIPRAYEGFRFLADDISSFAKAYVNYYSSMAK